MRENFSFGLIKWYAKWIYKHNKLVPSFSSISGYSSLFSMSPVALFLSSKARSQRDHRKFKSINEYTWRFSKGKCVFLATFVILEFPFEFWPFLHTDFNTFLVDVCFIVKRKKIWHWRRWWWQTACMCWQRHQLIWCVLNICS